MAKYGQIWPNMVFARKFGDPITGDQGIPEKIIQNAVCKMEFAWHPNPEVKLRTAEEKPCAKTSSVQ